MLRALRLDDDAPWKQRRRVPVILGTQLAKAAPTRGLAVGTLSGVYQLYAWDLPTGELRPLTDRQFGGISPDGRYVWYLEDQQGNEIGHFMRVPFEGGTPVDLTPAMAPYATRGGAISQAGNLFGFTMANSDGHHLCCLALGPEGSLGTARMLYHSPREFWNPVLSHRGELAVMASTARAGKRQFSLLAFDTGRGTQIAELWDGPESSLQPIAFS